MIKPLVLALSMTLTTAAMAQDTSCYASATAKKLHGVAKSDFLEKCKKDARAACEVASREKKLTGADMASFESKCVRDAVGEPKPN